jgi:hypothetical protein
MLLLAMLALLRYPLAAAHSGCSTSPNPTWVVLESRSEATWTSGAQYQRHVTSIEWEVVAVVYHAGYSSSGRLQSLGLTIVKVCNEDDCADRRGRGASTKSTTLCQVAGGTGKRMEKQTPADLSQQQAFSDYSHTVRKPPVKRGALTQRSRRSMTADTSHGYKSDDTPVLSQHCSQK